MEAHAERKRRGKGEEINFDSLQLIAITSLQEGGI
jgi:hypothetical protein